MNAYIEAEYDGAPLFMDLNNFRLMARTAMTFHMGEEFLSVLSSNTVPHQHAVSEVSLGFDTQHIAALDLRREPDLHNSLEFSNAIRFKIQYGSCYGAYSL